METDNKSEPVPIPKTKGSLTSTQIVSVLSAIVVLYVLLFRGGIIFLVNHGNITVVLLSSLLIISAIFRYLEHKKDRGPANPSQTSTQTSLKEVSISKVGATLAAVIGFAIVVFFTLVILGATVFVIVCSRGGGC